MTGLFYRRMFWLVLFGLIHAHLILWMGDILYLYGVCGMLVYLFRNVKPSTWCWAFRSWRSWISRAGTLFYQHIREARIGYVEAQAGARQKAGRCTEARPQRWRRWREIEKSLIPNRDGRQGEHPEDEVGLRDGREPHAAAWRSRWRRTFLPLMIWDSLALMLLGSGPLPLGIPDRLDGRTAATGGCC